MKKIATIPPAAAVLVSEVVLYHAHAPYRIAALSACTPCDLSLESGRIVRFALPNTGEDFRAYGLTVERETGRLYSLYHGDCVLDTHLTKSQALALAATVIRYWASGANVKHPDQN